MCDGGGGGDSGPGGSAGASSEADTSSGAVTNNPRYRAPAAPVATAPVATGPSETELARQAQLEREQAEARRQQEANAAFESRLNSAFGSGVESANAFFSSRGVDPARYSQQIQAAAEQRRGLVPQGAGEAGSYFSGLGETLYNDLTSGLRTRAMSDINRIGNDSVVNSRLGDTIDDATLESILGEQRGGAESYAKNLSSRGLITDSGLEAAMAEIERQAGLGRNKLSQFGTGLIEQGRSGARDIIGQGRSSASNADLATGFDSSAFESNLNNFFNSFLGSLDSQLRESAPTDLFNTSVLGSLGGAAGGAGTPKPGGSGGGQQQGPGEEDDEAEDDDEDRAF